MKDMEELAPDYLDIGMRLKAVRKGFSDLNQTDWADKHGFTKTQYNNWEKGKRRIPVEAALKLVDQYGLTLDALYRNRLDGLSDKALKVFLSAAPNEPTK